VLVSLAVATVVYSMRVPLFDGAGAVNLHVLQAEAFVSGETAIDQQLHNSAVYEGRIYSPYPPMPAVLLMPPAALFEPSALNAAWISLLLTGLNAFLLTMLLARVNVAPNLRPWLVAGFFLGTAYWFSLRESQWVWHYTHVVATAFLLLALIEALGRGRGWLVGLMLGGAVLSRQMMILAAVALLYLLWRRETDGSARYRNIAGLAATTGICLAAYLVLNWVRFDSPFETGYAFIDHGSFLADRFREHGLFSPAYLPFNLTHMFLEGPHFAFADPSNLREISTNEFGTSILLASPFVLVALYANWRDGLVRAFAVSVLLMLGMHLLYYNNGWVQTNAQRFTLDYWPLLIVVCGLGLQARAERGEERLWKGLIVWAVVLNVLTIAFLPEVNDLFSTWEDTVTR